MKEENKIAEQLAKEALSMLKHETMSSYAVMIDEDTLSLKVPNVLAMDVQNIFKFLEWADHIMDKATEEESLVLHMTIAELLVGLSFKAEFSLMVEKAFVKQGKSVASAMFENMIKCDSIQSLVDGSFFKEFDRRFKEIGRRD